MDSSDGVVLLCRGAPRLWFRKEMLRSDALMIPATSRSSFPYTVGAVPLLVGGPKLTLDAKCSRR